jgi:DNA-binding winged helix-turn-helix (wHTH) protein/Tol biopolymer transport system component
MPETSSATRIIRFGAFEVDLRAGELRRNGLKIKLQEQPFQVLAMLLRHPGDVVTREELQRTVWPADTFVDFDRGLNKAVNKIREALNDSADNPRFVETLPRRGYRFIAPVEGRVGAGAGLPTTPGQVALPTVEPEGEPLGAARAHQGMPLQATPRGAVREPVLRRQWVLRTAALLAAGVFALLLVAGVTLWLAKRWPNSSQGLEQRRLTSNSTEIPLSRGAISPDGKYVAYSDPGGLHLKLLQTAEVRTLPPPPGIPPGVSWEVASWFPGSTQLLTNIVQLGGRSSIWVVSVVGENPRLLRDDAMAWAVSPDGSRLAFTVGPPFYNREIWIMGARGGTPQKVITAGENEYLCSYFCSLLGHGSIQWSPDGGRIAYRQLRHRPDGWEATFRTINLNGEESTVVVSDPLLRDFLWLPGGRFIYSRIDPSASPSGSNCNLWEVHVDARTGVPLEKPRQLTRWAGFGVEMLSSTIDGKHLAFLRGTRQAQTFVGLLEAGGTRMQAPQRLTYSEAMDYPWAWTPDSKAVIFTSDRNGEFEVFKENLDQKASHSLTTSSQNADMVRLSPDASWILYMLFPKSEGSSTRIPLMRVLVSGGQSQLVLETNSDADFWCATAPAKFCALNERTPNRESLTVTAFDPVKGRGRVLMSIPTDRLPYYNAKPSPDGSHFALLKVPESEGHIRLLTPDGRVERDITIKSWPGFITTAWAPDGRGIYCGTITQQGAALLRVNLDGTAEVLWQQKGTPFSNGTWGIPSPDGRYLAIMSEVTDSNLWMVEGF